MSDAATSTSNKPLILVVDDSRVIRKAVSTILSEKYSIVEAQNGEEALMVLQQRQDFNAVLLDLWMPDVDGFEVLETIRNSSLPALLKLPVIIVTGHEDDADMRKKAEKLGATAFVGKPFSARELRDAVATHLAPSNTSEHNTSSTVVPFKPAEKAPALTQQFAPTEELVPPPTSTPVAPPAKTPEDKVSALRQARKSYLQKEGERLLSESRKNRKPLALLRIRVDKIKALLQRTDTEFTKRSLFQLSKYLEGETRRKDLLVRIGAADFMLLMPNTSAPEAEAMANALFRVMRYTAYEYGELKFRMTLSAGLITPPTDSTQSFEELQKVAENRTEQALKAGGNQLVSHHAPTQATESLSLDEANIQLRNGNTQPVSDQLPELLEKNLPLLVFANSMMNLGIQDALKLVLRNTHKGKKQNEN